MPPVLALFFCTVFVIFLLRLERKQLPEVSFALWIPTIWMLLIACKPLGTLFGTGSEDMESGSSLDRAVLIALLCLGLIILAQRQFILSNAIKENIWVMMLIGFMLASILWSDLPYISFKRWTREIIAVVMAFLIITEPEPRQALQSIFRRIIYILIPFSYMLIHYFPSYGREYSHSSGALMWTGVASQKNSLGQLCLFAAFFLIWTFIRRRLGRDIPATRYQTLLEAFILILTFWLMGGPQHNVSYSATTNIAFVAGLSALVTLIWMKKRGTVFGPNAFIVIIAFIIVYGSITPFVGRLSLMDISSIFGRSETLTGRSKIWTTLIPYAMQKPILGHGFGGFWTEAIRSLTSSHAHNGYLDVILNIGFFGLLLFAIFLLSCGWKAQRVMIQDFDWGSLFICFLLMAVVHNIAESSIVGFTGELSAVLLFMAVSSTSIPEVSKKCDVS
jgi:exopolysaccharide production protein ExoQ